MEFQWVELVGYAGTAATIATYSMRTIVPLRIAGIVSSLFFIAYASILGIWPMLATELVILPLNCLRLFQIVRMMRQIRAAAHGQFLSDWLHPFATNVQHRAGEILFRAGDHADYVVLIQSGRFRLVEQDIEIPPNTLVGELGLVAQDNRRSMTLECVEAGTVGKVSYSNVRMLYFQNPQFAYYFLHLVGGRLFDNLQATRDQRDRLSAAAQAWTDVEVSSGIRTTPAPMHLGASLMPQVPTAPQ